MTASVRNGVLGRVLTAAGPETSLGVVPAGSTWLLKSYYVLNGNLATATVSALLRTAGGLPVARLKTWELAPGAHDFWEGWIALMPGDELLVEAPGLVHAWASGAELPGEMPARAAHR